MSPITDTVRLEENETVLLQEIQKVRISQCKKVEDRAECY